MMEDLFHDWRFAGCTGSCVGFYAPRCQRKSVEPAISQEYTSLEKKCALGVKCSSQAGYMIVPLVLKHACGVTRLSPLLLSIPFQYLQRRTT